MGGDRQECLSYGEALDFVNDGVRRQAAALATNEGDDAVGTTGVAAVLDLEGGASVIPFPAEDGGAEQHVLFENITGEDFCRSEGE